MILLIDNYDSFAYNLFQMVGNLNPDMKVIRNNAASVEEIEDMKPDAIILSPGPGRPADAGICEEVVRRMGGKVPLLGVCLGHQAIGEAFGAKITYAKEIMHGKQSVMEVDNTCQVFKGLPSKVAVGRYHSLAIDEKTLPEEFQITARADDGEIMAIAHREYVIYGMQFHPESIMTPEGGKMLSNFMEVCKK